MSHWERFISVVGAVRIILVLGGVYVVLGAIQVSQELIANGSFWEILIDLILFVSPATALFYGGYWIRRSEIHPSRYPSIVSWCLGGLTVMLAITSLFVLDTDAVLGQPLRTLGSYTAIGSVGGLGVGVMEAQALTRTAEAEKRGQALRESKEQLRTLIDVLPVAVYIADTDGEIIEWNDAAEKVWSGEIDGSGSVAEYDEHDAWWVDTGNPVEPHERTLARTLRGEEVTDPDEIKIRGGDGEYRTVLNQGMPIRDADGAVSRAVVTLVDITEQKERGRELGRHETIFETITDGIILVDNDATIRAVNDALVEMTGYPRERLVGADASLIRPDDLDQEMTSVQASLDAGADTESVETMIQPADAEQFPTVTHFAQITLDDGTAGRVGVIRDISDQVKRERRLEESERQYRTLVDNFPSGAVGLYDENLRWIKIGGENIRQIGLTAAEMEGKRIQEIAPDPLAEVMTPHMRVAIEEGKRETFETEYDGHQYLFRTLPVRNDDGTIFAGMIVSQDITERKELEVELRQERDLRERIFETSPTGIMLVESDGAIPFINEDAADLLQAPEDRDSDVETLLSRVEVTTPDGMQAKGDLFRDILATGEPVQDIERQITHPDGQQIWLSINGVPLRDSAGEVTAVVFTLSDITELKQYQDRLISLNELSQNLTDAETEQAVSELVIKAVRETLPLPLGVVALYDEKQGQLRYVAQTSEVAELVGDGQLFESAQGLPWQVFSDQTEAVYEDLQEQTDVSELDTPLRSAIILPLGEHGVLISGSTTADTFSEMDVSIAQMLAANMCSALDRVGREQTLRDQTETLEEQNTALERVQRVNEIIRGITTELIQAPTREDILQAVCDRLADADAYRFVWIGAQDPVTDHVLPEAWAGVEKDYLETVTVIADESEHGQGPTARASRTHEPQVENNLAVDPPFDTWQQAALDRGYQAAIAIPLVYQDTQFGVLTLYAGQSGVFNQMEEAVLLELGEIIGYALNALERKQALVSGKSVELEFRLRGGEPPILQFAIENGCEYEFENLVQTADGLPRIFFTVRGMVPDDLLQFAEQHPDLEDIAIVSEQENAAMFEGRLRDSSFFSTLLDRGAMLQSLTATEEEAYSVIRVPQSSNIRTFVELYEAQFEGVELVGRREVDESVMSQQEFGIELRSQLTERQEEVLQTAYLSGFFNSPRTMSAQELAELLDVSQPTVSRHIRAGERELFGLVFDEE